MKLVAWMLVFSISFFAFGQEASQEIKSASSIYSKAAKAFAQGNYQATVHELNSLEQDFIQRGGNKEQLGFIYYWKGISYNRLQEFSLAIAHFDKALGMDYVPKDLHYEYGQALFAADKLSEARLQFRESLRKKFKRAVSLYYIAYTSKELGDKKKAVAFYRAIHKLRDAEAAEVKQAAEMQIGDIYLEQVEKHPDSFRAVEAYVIPQYKKALSLDPDSPLSSTIEEKIVMLQRKYDLVLFRLRNGRPTLVPPYFLRVAQELGWDSNVTFEPTETTISEANQGSYFSRTDVIGRYTFYHKDFLSFSPEFRANYTRYFNRIPDIYRNDNYLIAPALRTSYEHEIWKKPASVLLDYEYSEANRDVNSKEVLEFASRSHTFMIGERFNYFDDGETIIRITRRMFESYLSTNDSESLSFSIEQVKILTENMLLFYLSHDRIRVEDELYDTDSWTFRTDLITKPYRGITPSFGFGVTKTDPMNNSERGDEWLFNPSARLSKSFGKNWRGNLKFDYMENQSNDKTNFAFRKTQYSFELEYIF